MALAAARGAMAVDAVVIGAGVVGLAVARALAQQGREVFVLEEKGAVGSVTSSRNSEVIHAGLYYPQGSVKARTCVRGRDMLYEYCERRGVPHRRCGKLIVATTQQQCAQLETIRQASLLNGVDDLRLLTRDQAQELEPHVRCEAALLSPSTGILDSHSYMEALQHDAEEVGAMFALRTAVKQGIVEQGDDGAGTILLRTEEARDAHDDDAHDGQDEGMWLSANIVVNAAGLNSVALARTIQGLDPRTLPAQHYAKGNYFALAGSGTPFSRLVYPVPDPNTAGLGVHATIDLSGRARFGPDVQWLEPGEKVSYEVEPDRADAFYDAVRTYYPALADGALVSDYCGVRPKLSAPGEPAADFVISTQAEHGVPGYLGLYGIESPGLTASLALAELVLEGLGLGDSGDGKVIKN